MSDTLPTRMNPPCRALPPSRGGQIHFLAGKLGLTALQPPQVSATGLSDDDRHPRLRCAPLFDGGQSLYIYPTPGLDLSMTAEELFSNGFVEIIVTDASPSKLRMGVQAPTGLTILREEDVQTVKIPRSGAVEMVATWA